MDSLRWKQIEELYHAALECDPVERAALLDGAEPELRREVESLLAQESSPDGVLNRPAWENANNLLDATRTQLTSGSQLGPYRIKNKIGEGGMGAVYRAHDSRLGRDIAIKVAASQFTGRFEREARAVAALNHPNICTLHDVGPNFLVMELVEGETLAARVKKGKLSIKDTLRYGTQIADALAAAHAKGIIHRDLKPGNIMLTKSGAKVLDFGLAKSQHDASMTASNVVMGTPAYMAPEHLAGKECDARTDIYALGLVLYEMSTGERVEQGHMPPMEQLPEKLAHAIELCITQDPDDRWQSASDLKRELMWVATASGEAAPGAVSRYVQLLWALAGVSTLAFILSGVGWYNATRPTELKQLMRLNVEITPDTPLAGGDIGSGIRGNMLALSPDGTRLALTLRGTDGKVRLHTRLLNQNQVTPLAGTENAHTPFFSPAGDWIGFFAEGKLKKIAVEGGVAVTLCDAPLGFGASWGDDGSIIATLTQTGVLSRVPSGGGRPVPVTKLNPGEVTHRWPQVLPGSQAVLFTSAAQISLNYDDSNIEVISLKNGERKTVQRGGFSARYLADATVANGTGYLIYLHESTLFAVPFDARRLTPVGAPTRILEDVSSTAAAGGDYSFAGAPSGAGPFVYLSTEGSREGWPISWIDSFGKTQPLHAPLGQYFFPRFSPDGKRLAFASSTGNGSDIWVKDLDRDTPSRLSFLPGMNRWPVWTPDGKNIVFHSDNPAAPGLYGIRSDGSSEAQPLTESKTQEIPSSFSPDGKRLAVAVQDAGNGGSLDIFTRPVEVDPERSVLGFRLGKAELYLGTPFIEDFPAFSPDGRWLAFSSTVSGTREVWVRPFPGPGGRWQVSSGGGNLPLWSRDGHELLFETLDQRVMAASYTANADSFTASKPRVWTETRLRGTGMFANFDLAPDGKRLAAFVADDTKGEKPLTHLTFLLNFFDELRRRVPAGK